MVMSAQRSQVALASQAATLEWRGVVEVALAGGTAASGERTSLLPDSDQVLQRQRWPVGRGLPLVGAPGGLEPFHGDTRQPADTCQPGGRSGATIGRGGTMTGRGGTMTGWDGAIFGRGGTGRGGFAGVRRWCRARRGGFAGVVRWRWAVRRWCRAGRGGRRAVPRAGAAVGDRSAVPAGQRYAPAGLWVVGHSRAEVTAVVGGQWAEPGYLAGCVLQAEPRTQWHGQVDHARHGRYIRPASARRRTGPVRARRKIGLAGWAWVGRRAGAAGGRVWLLLAGRQQRGGGHAAEQGDEQAGADLVGGASQPCGPQSASQGGNVLVGGDHRGRGKVTACERGRAGVLVPAFDAGFPLCLLLPLPGGTRIGGEYRPPGRRSHLRGGLSGCSNQDVLLHSGRVVIVKPDRLVGDDAHAGKIDHPGFERPGRQGQAPQCHGQVQHAPGAATGQR